MLSDGWMPSKHCESIDLPKNLGRIRPPQLATSFISDGAGIFDGLGRGTEAPLTFYCFSSGVTEAGACDAGSWTTGFDAGFLGAGF